MARLLFNPKSFLNLCFLHKPNVFFLPQSPVSPHGGRHKSDANSPWKNHLAMLKRAKEEAGEAKLSESTALLAAQQVNDGLMSSVQDQLEGVRSETAAVAKELRAEVGASGQELAGRLEGQIEAALVSVKERLEPAIFAQEEMARETKTGLATLNNSLAAARVKHDQVASQVQEHASLLATATSNLHRLDEKLDAVEERLDDKLADAVGASAKQLEDAFVDLFNGASAAFSTRADATEALAKQVAADQLADKERITTLAEACAEVQGEMAAFKNTQQLSMDEVIFLGWLDAVPTLLGANRDNRVRHPSSTPPQVAHHSTKSPPCRLLPSSLSRAGNGRLPEDGRGHSLSRGRSHQAGPGGNALWCGPRGMGELPPACVRIRRAWNPTRGGAHCLLNSRGRTKNGSCLHPKRSCRGIRGGSNRTKAKQPQCAKPGYLYIQKEHQ